jgi:hypothetical protein
MTALALLLSEEDTASFFTIKFLKMEIGNGCPHNVFTQHTPQLTAAHSAGNLSAISVLTVTANTSFRTLYASSATCFGPVWPSSGRLLRHAADDKYIVQ